MLGTINLQPLYLLALLASAGAHQPALADAMRAYSGAINALETKLAAMKEKEIALKVELKKASTTAGFSRNDTTLHKRCACPAARVGSDGLSLQSRPRRLVISITQSQLRRFRRRNPHLNATLFPGVAGDSGTSWPRALATEEVVQKSTHHDLGIAETHRRLWNQIAASGRTTLVMEDDLVISRRIDAFEDELSEEIEASDITLCYANMNSIVTLVDDAGVSRTVLSPELQPPTAKFAKKALSRTKRCPSLFRLVHGFGTACYWITARGARRLSEAVYPLRAGTTRTLPLALHIDEMTVDRRLQAIYSTVDARITLPFVGYATRHTPR